MTNKQRFKMYDEQKELIFFGFNLKDINDRNALKEEIKFSYFNLEKDYKYDLEYINRGLQRLRETEYLLLSEDVCDEYLEKY